MIENLKIVPNDLLDRTWYSKNDVYAFLVDAPITFGHSQLIVRIGESKQEEDVVFRNASLHISNCIRTLRTRLSKINLDKYAALALYTGSTGKYMKTLIFKASASEKKYEYKIHLIPYFSSHLRSTKSLDYAIQDIGKKKPGGLIHWVGERERIVDYDMRYGRNDKRVIKRINSFKLNRLSSDLRKK
jgi:hypothetical protein